MRWVSLGALVIGLSGCAPSSPSRATSLSAADGEASYRAQDCARCHGASGEGGRALALLPVTQDADAWLRALRSAHGREYPTTRLSDAQARAIHQWLLSQR